MTIEEELEDLCCDIQEGMKLSREQNIRFLELCNEVSEYYSEGSPDEIYYRVKRRMRQKR